MLPTRLSAPGAIVVVLLSAAGAAAQPETDLNITFQWQDQAGTQHGMRGARLEVLDENNISYGSVAMNNSGFVSTFLTADEPDDVIEAWFRMRVSLPGVVSNIFSLTNLNMPTQATSSTRADYFTPFTNLTEGAAHTFTLGTSGATADTRGFIAAQIMDSAHTYYNNRLNFNPDAINLRYQFAGNQAFYNAPSGGNPGVITFAGDDYRDYDVIAHEYGHHAAAANGMDESPGGTHTFFADAIRARKNIAQGSRLAYNEGLATYLGATSLRGANAINALNLPATATDTWYNDDNWNANGTFSSGNLSYNLELQQTRTGTGAAQNSVSRLGEGDEVAVSRILWDLHDNNTDSLSGIAGQSQGSDRIAYGDKGLWDRVLTPNGGAATTQELWGNLTDDLRSSAGRTAAGVGGLHSNNAIERAGAIFQEQGVSADAVTRGVFHLFANPVLTAREQNNDNSEWFRAAFFDVNWNFVGWTDPVHDPMHTDPTAMNNAPTLSTISFDLIGQDLFFLGIDFEDDFFYWVTLSNPAGDTSFVMENDFELYGTSWYWSAGELIEVVPTPGSATLLALGGIVVFGRRRRHV